MALRHGDMAGSVHRCALEGGTVRCGSVGGSIIRTVTRGVEANRPGIVDGAQQARRRGDGAVIMREAVQERAAETGRLMIVYSGAMWGAGGGGQRPDQLAIEAAADACVVHVNPLNSLSSQVPVRDVVRVNGSQVCEWLEVLKAPRKLFYSAFPTAQCWDWMGSLDENWCVWYDCVDDWSDFQGNDWWCESRERNIARRADVVTATARKLEAHCRGWGADPLFLPNSTLLLSQPVPEDVEPEYDLIFCGSMGGNWFDWELLKALIVEGFSIRLIGHLPRRGKPLQSRALDWYGMVPNEKLRRVLATGRVGIIPFRDLPVTHAVWPIKYADYLAAGLPTVAAYMPELEGADFCTVAYSQKDFIRACHNALREAKSINRAEIMLSAEKHTAAARFAAVLPLLEKAGGW
jgi:hypothetical protein